jgi:hypothetical protein
MNTKFEERFLRALDVLEGKRPAPLMDLPADATISDIRSFAQPSRTPCSVYFFRSGDRVKIGISDRVQSRLYSVRTSCPEPVVLVWVEECRSRKAALHRERELHLSFAAYRLRGEWFQWCPEIDAHVNGPQRMAS